MSHSITGIVESIKDSELAKLRVTLRNGEPIHLDCIYKVAEPPNFLLVFPPKTIPEECEINQKCSVAISSETEPLTLSASIQAFHGDRSIELQAIDTIDPVSLREYFRVAFSTTVRVSFEPPGEDSRLIAWNVNGSTVDLSGTGLLGVFPKEFENKNNLIIEIELPELNRRVMCRGRVVRSRRLRKHRFQVALHFEHITRKDRDAVITACLQEQRRQLRQRMEL